LNVFDIDSTHNNNCITSCDMGQMFGTVPMSPVILNG
jgi:hypothetical protein